MNFNDSESIISLKENFMYLFILLIIVIIALVYYINNKSADPRDEDKLTNIDEKVSLYTNGIFDFSVLESPHFIDYQNAFDVMETNYLRLKQRFISNYDKVLEYANDWSRYVEALYTLKFARELLHVDMTQDAYDNAGKKMKEPLIIKEEIENKFKKLLGAKWKEIPSDYFTRLDLFKKKHKIKSDIFDDIDWEQLYINDENYIKMIKKRNSS